MDGIFTRATPEERDSKEWPMGLEFLGETEERLRIIWNDREEVVPITFPGLIDLGEKRLLKTPDVAEWNQNAPGIPYPSWFIQIGKTKPILPTDSSGK